MKFKMHNLKQIEQTRFILSTLIGNLYTGNKAFEQEFIHLWQRLELNGEPDLALFEAFMIEVVTLDATEKARGTKKIPKEMAIAKRKDMYLLTLGLLKDYYHSDETTTKKISLGDRRIKYILNSDYVELISEGKVHKKDIPKAGIDDFVKKCKESMDQYTTRCKDNISEFLSTCTDKRKQTILSNAQKHIENGKIKLPDPSYTLKNFPLSTDSDTKNIEKEYSHADNQPILGAENKIEKNAEKEYDLIHQIEALINNNTITAPKFNAVELPSYTLEEVNAGALDNKIIFNSVCNNPYVNNNNDYDEHHFVVAREAKSSNAWESDTIFVENNHKYEICVRVKNDNPNGINAIAQDTTVFCNISKYYAKTVPVNGCITSSNARPKHYEDQVYFSSRSNFRLDVVKNSIILKNHGIGKNNGVRLGTNIFTQNGAVIGYDSLDGCLPGGDEYTSIIAFKVKAIFDTKDIIYTISTTVRLVGDSDKSWKNEVDAKIGNKVEFQIEYTNTSDARQNNVAIDDILPSNLHYVKGTTKLYNGSFPKGFLVDSDEVVASGIYVGHYEAGANALIRFQAEVVDDDFTCGKFILHNWGRASIGDRVMQDSAAVVVQLPYCPDLGNGNTTKG